MKKSQNKKKTNVVAKTIADDDGFDIAMRDVETAVGEGVNKAITELGKEGLKLTKKKKRKIVVNWCICVYISSIIITHVT